MNLLDLLLPPVCPVCARMGVPPGARLCGACAPRIHPGVVDLDDGLRVATCFRYADVRDAIHALKFHDQAWRGAALGMVLGASLPPVVQRPVIVPIPLGRTRQRERGYNQARILADGVRRHVGGTVDVGILRRVRETEAQSRRGAGARADIAGAFAARAPRDPDRRVLLVDDVITTGATLRSAVDALRRAGWEEIDACCVAHAELD